MCLSCNSYKIFLSILLFLIFVSVSSSITFASNDWPMFLKDPTHSGYNSDEKILMPDLKLKWTFKANSFSSASISNNYVFVRSGGFLYALDALSGSVKWSYNYKQPIGHTSPTVSQGIVYIGNYVGPGNFCANCSLQALDMYTGSLKWEIKLARGARDPNIVDNVAYFGSDDGFIRAADATSGQLIWVSPKLGNGVIGVPAVAYGKVYAGTDTGMFYALNATNGSIIWQYPLAGLIFSSPSVSEGTVFVGSGMNYIYALDTETGMLKWKFTNATDSVWGSPAILDGKVFIQDLAGKIFALDTINGNLIWSFKTNAKPSSSYSSPAIANGVLYLGSQDGSIYAFNPEDGTLIWQFATGGQILSSPSIANKFLYFGSTDGYFYAFENTLPQLPALDVVDVKQYSVPWKDDVYDHATNWASDSSSIERWGCALTCASMILQYHGHGHLTSNPGSLNIWLTNQTDGYLRNGQVNWLAISRYTKIKESPSSPALLYRRLLPDDNVLAKELTFGRPSILKVGKHFVVAKSQLLNSFGINDPAYSDRTTLVPYENSYSGIGSFQPTQTDLSYLMLAVDQHISMKVFAPDGSEISGNQFIETPLLSDTGKVEESGKTLNIFLLPTPSLGTYEIYISGDGHYVLDSYLYNIDGNVLQASYSGTVRPEQPDQYSLVWSSTPTFSKDLTLLSILNDVDEAFSKGLLLNKGLYNALKKLLSNAVRTLN